MGRHPRGRSLTSSNAIAKLSPERDCRMSRPEQVFRRIPGEGWLVLAGSNPELGGETADLMECLLERLDLSRPIGAIAADDSDTPEVNEILESLEEWLRGAGGL